MLHNILSPTKKTSQAFNLEQSIDINYYVYSNADPGRTSALVISGNNFFIMLLYEKTKAVLVSFGVIGKIVKQSKE